jgi:hypothetical protein
MSFIDPFLPPFFITKCLAIKGKYHPYPIGSELGLSYCDVSSKTQKWYLDNGGGGIGYITMNASKSKYTQGECIDCSGDCGTGDFPTIQDCCVPGQSGCEDQTWQYYAGIQDGTPILSGKNTNLVLQPSSNNRGAIVAMYPSATTTRGGRDSERWVYNARTLQLVSALNPQPADPMCLHGHVGTADNGQEVCCRSDCIIPGSGGVPGCTLSCDAGGDANCCVNLIEMLGTSCNSVVGAPCLMNVPDETCTGNTCFCLDIIPPVQPQPTPTPPTPPPTPPTPPPTPVVPTPPPSPGMCQVLPNYDCPGNDMFSQPISDAEACCALCISFGNGCTAYTYDPDYGFGPANPQCYLKTACPKPQKGSCETGGYGANCTSGLVKSTPPPPTPPPTPPTPPPPTPPPTPPVVCPWAYQSYAGWCWQLHSTGREHRLVESIVW